jgi:hypothetical protein
VLSAQCCSRCERKRRHARPIAKADQCRPHGTGLAVRHKRASCASPTDRSIAARALTEVAKPQAPKRSRPRRRSHCRSRRRGVAPCVDVGRSGSARSGARRARGETEAASGAGPSLTRDCPASGRHRPGWAWRADPTTPALWGVVERRVMARGRLRCSKAVSSRRAPAPHRRSRRGRPRRGGRRFLRPSAARRRPLVSPPLQFHRR